MQHESCRTGNQGASFPYPVKLGICQGAGKSYQRWVCTKTYLEYIYSGASNGSRDVLMLKRKELTPGDQGRRLG